MPLTTGALRSLLVVIATAACAKSDSPSDEAAAPQAAAGQLAATVAENGPAPRSDQTQPYVKTSLRGRVVWTADVLQRQFNISTVAEARERSLCLEASDGRIYPIVEDARGRALRKDPRLRETDVSLDVRYFPTAGVVQIVRLHFMKPDGKYLVDYWCDVCSITMIEDGPCDCCQEHNRLRERLIKEPAR